jgi:hypothetical protein
MMRIKGYRISFLIVLFLFGLLCLASTFYTSLSLGGETTDSLWLFVICYLMILFVYVFEIIHVFKSFTSGTVVLSDLLFDSKHRVRLPYLIFFSALGLITLLASVYFGMMFFIQNKNWFLGIVSTYLDALVFNTSTLMFINSLYVILYYFLFRREGELI